MKWGVVGYGEIAPTFIEALNVVNGQHLVAIASKSKSHLLTSSNRYPNVKVFSNYQALVDDSEIDAVYICTTNQLHKENVIAALKAGKNVLCEKPIGVCRSDVEEMVLEARKQNRFLMEGMWTRFLPAYKHFKQLLENGAIGKVSFARVDFGFVSDWGQDRRLKNRALLGGTLLDNADYGIFLTQDVFGDTPSSVSAFAHYCETGVEDTCGIMFRYSNGAIAQLYSSFLQKTNQEALIYGDKGYLHLKPFWNGTVVDIHNREGVKSKSFPFVKNGFEFEIVEVFDCVQNKQIESRTIPHNLSLEMAGLMDEIIERVKR